MSIHPHPTLASLANHSSASHRHHQQEHDPHQQPQPPAQPSSSRRPSKPGAANDVRVNPASSEVISSLLASLSSISLPSESPSPLIPHQPPRSPQLPPASPQFPSAAASARPSISQRPPSSQARSPREPSIDFAQAAYPPDPEDILEPPQLQSDAAEPPTIRTARPPSGLSALTAPRSLRKSKQPAQQSSSNGIYAALSNFPSPPSSARSSKTRLDGPLPPLPKISTDRLKSRAGLSSSRKASIVDEPAKPRGLGLQRDSLLLLRSREAKGKDKEQTNAALDTAARAQASTSSLPPPISRFRALSPRGAQTVGPSRVPSQLNSRVASRVASPTRSFFSPQEDDEDDDDDDAALPPSVPLRRKTSGDDHVVVRAGPSDSRPSMQDSRTVIPSRSSSLRDRSDSPTRGMRLLSRRSSRQSHHKSPETVPEETFAQEAFVHDEIMSARNAMPPSPLSPLTPMSPVSLDEENDVVKRIKQLRAAMDKRERDQSPVQIQSAPSSPRAPQSIPMNGIAKPPDTSRAIKQLNEAEQLEERKIRVQDNYPARSASLTPTSTAFAFQSLPPDVAPVRPSTARPSSPLVPGSPAFSRSSSRGKRFSSDLSPRKASAHKRDGSRGKNPISIQPSVVEERRPSIDSVKESVTEYLKSTRLSQKILSPVDRRTISFSEVGDPNGFAVFVCIGMGLTRFITAFYEELATTLKLRLITPERPGIGDSTAYAEQRAPLFWADDVRAICTHLSIRNFSLIAHSAGTVYALATALQMPSRVKGKIHLLAPWIPPSQMTSVGRSNTTNVRAGSLPRAQRLLRYMPNSFLKLTNNAFLAGERPKTKSPLIKGRKSGDSSVNSPRLSTSTRPFNASSTHVALSTNPSARPSVDRFRPPMTPNLEEIDVPLDHNFTEEVLSAGRRPSTAAGRRPATATTTAAAPQKRYDEELTSRLWVLATRGGNPAVDLIVILEKNQPIGFRYADIKREVLIRHGSKDGRVPLENVKWLGSTMQKAELRVLEGESHGLMGNAGVMAQVLSDVGKEWEMGANGILHDSSSYKSPIMEEDAEAFDDDL